MADKYGLNSLGIGDTVYVADTFGEMQKIGGYHKMYRRLFYLANQKGIKVSINKNGEGLNVKRIS